MDQNKGVKLTNIDICYTDGEEIRDNISVVYTENATREVALSNLRTGLLVGSFGVIIANFAIIGFKTFYENKKVSKKPIGKSVKKNSKK